MNKKIMYFGVIVGIIGFLWLCQLNPKIASAVLLMMWGDNITKRSHAK